MRTFHLLIINKIRAKALNMKLYTEMLNIERASDRKKLMLEELE